MSDLPVIPQLPTPSPGILWSMVWREMRGALRQFLFFLACIMLGVGSLVGVAGFSSSINRAITHEARALMAGDIEVRTNRPMSAEGVRALDALRDRGVEWTTSQEMVAMATTLESGATQLVELKAVGTGYPFYGELISRPASASALLTEPSHALVEEGLLVRLGLKPGDQITLGRAELVIAGIIEKEPDRVAGAFSLGPRVLIARQTLEQTQLVQPGSRVRHRHLLKLPAGMEPAGLVEELKRSLTTERAQISSYEEAQPRLRRFLENLTTYLGLVGLISLLVGGIGVANSVQAFLKGKLDSLATLKCLGADSRTILRIYLTQTLLLGGLGSLAGVLLGLAIQWLLPLLLSDFLPASVERSVAVLPIVRGMTMGLMTTLLFSLWPLLAIRQIPPARFFRRDVEENQLVAGGDRPWLTATLMVSGLILLALWQIGSLGIGGTFVGVVSGSMLLLWAAAWLMIRLLKSTPRRGSLVWRQGLSNLYRPGSQALSALLSVGVGVTVILAIYLVESDLIHHIEENLPTESPSFFFIDIQADQQQTFTELVEQQGLIAELTPIVRTRLWAVNGRPVTEMIASGELDGRSDAWYFQRDYVVTFDEKLPPDNRLTQGRWWGPEEDRNEVLISVEDHAAQHLGIGLGSTLTFDIQGQQITATVASLRDVGWGNLSTNFFIIFSPGALEAFPLTYIATMRTRPDQDLPLQRAIVAALPNVTAINIRYVLDTVQTMLERIALVIHLMAVLTIVAGLIVLSGAMATTRYRRIREAVILKTLGATRLVVARIFAVEYTALGIVSGFIGALMATLLSFILLRFFMDVPWRFQPGALIIGVLVATVLTAMAGFLTTYRILGEKPLAVLRHE